MEECPKIILNMGYCGTCRQVLVSLTRHDFRICVGNHGFVDGGHDYLRSGGSIVNCSVVLDNGVLTFADSSLRFTISRNDRPTWSGSPVGG